MLLINRLLQQAKADSPLDGWYWPDPRTP